jgi:integrase/recombinase XerC
MRYELTREKYLNDEELAILLVTLKKFESREPRNVCLIRLALATGARASELLSIIPADLDCKNNSVYIHGLKRCSDRWIPISRRLFRDLSHLDVGISGKYFDISYSRLAEIWNGYRTNKKRFHGLRHRFALDLYRKTMNVHLVQRALGHRTLDTTSIYMTYNYTLAEMRKAMCV